MPIWHTLLWRNVSDVCSFGAQSHNCYGKRCLAFSCSIFSPLAVPADMPHLYLPVPGWVLY